MVEGAAAGGEGGGNKAASEVAEVASSPTSPTGKVKLFCSHGGKILPRPSDGVLKYVGGETRVINVPRTISFSDLMKRISHLFDGEFILKFQIGLEDLDALVSVKSDEDLCHMLDEYDRIKTIGASKLRTFLFPTKPTTITIDPSLHHNHQHLFPLSIPVSLEQCYLDAINGVIRSTQSSVNMHPMIHSHLKSVSSSPSEDGTPNSLSPRSMIAQNSHNSPSVSADAKNIATTLHRRPSHMHKVKSSPSLCSRGGGAQQQNINAQLSNNIQIQPGCPGYPCSQYGHQHHHHCYNHCHQHYQHNLSGYHCPGGKPLQQEPHHTRGWPSVGRDEHGKVSGGGNRDYGHMGLSAAGCYSLKYKGYPGSGGHTRWAHLSQYVNGYGVGHG